MTLDMKRGLQSVLMPRATSDLDENDQLTPGFNTSLCARDRAADLCVVRQAGDRAAPITAEGLM